MPSVTPRIINPPFAFADLNTSQVQFTQGGNVNITAGNSQVIATALGVDADTNDIAFGVAQAIVTETSVTGGTILAEIFDNTVGGPFIDWFLAGAADPAMQIPIAAGDTMRVQVMGMGFMNANAQPVIAMRLSPIGCDVQVLASERWLNLTQFSSVA